MNLFRRTLACSCLAAAITIAAGCLEVDERYTVHEDGAVTWLATTEMGTQLLQLMAIAGDGDPLAQARSDFEQDRARLEGMEHVRSVRVIDEPSDQGHRLGFEIVVDEMTRLQQTFDRLASATAEQTTEEQAAAGQGSASGIEQIGHVSFARDDDAIVFRRLVNVDVSDDDAAGEDAASARPAVEAALAGKYYTVRLEADHVVETNGRYDPDAGAIVWRRSMVELLNADEPWELTARFHNRPASPGMVLWLAAGGLAVIVLGLVIVMLTRRRARRRSTPALP